MSDFAIGAAATAALVMIFILAYLSGRGSVESDCKKLGAFESNGAIYSCALKREQP